jgi:hypothetical protein
MPKCFFPDCPILNSRKYCLRYIFANINTVGVKMDRSWRATLSPRELASLQALRRDAKREILASHRQVLLAMGLIKAAGNELILTEIGNHRLDREERGHSYREGPHPQASS